MVFVRHTDVGRVLVVFLAVVCLTAACGSTQEELNSAAGSAATPTTKPSPSPTPGRPAGTLAPDTSRVSDDDGGWAIDIPHGWFEQPFAQHGREFRSYNPKGLDYGGNAPPPGGILVRLQMEQNPDQLDPAAFVAPQLKPSPGSEVRQRDTTAVAGQTAEFLVTWQSQPSVWQTLEPTFTWYVRSPFFADRMVVIHAYPLASPLRPAVERMLTTLQFYRPLPVVLTPLVSREQAIANATAVQKNVGATLTRVEAKLVLYKELERAGDIGHSFATDPDMLVWVVAYEGSGLSCGRGGPLGPPGMPPATTPPCHFGFSVGPARPPEMVGIFGSRPSWPTWFDTLVDRDH